jgi:hypothetical protein
MKKLFSFVLILFVLGAASCNRKGSCPAYDSSAKAQKKA